MVEILINKTLKKGVLLETCRSTSTKLRAATRNNEFREVSVAPTFFKGSGTGVNFAISRQVRFAISESQTHEVALLVQTKGYRN